MRIMAPGRRSRVCRQPRSISLRRPGGAHGNVPAVEVEADPVVLPTAARKGRNNVMIRSMKTWFVRRVGLDLSGISDDAPITSSGTLVAA
jgi:hypothetical protein